MLLARTLGISLHHGRSLASIAILIITLRSLGASECVCHNCDDLSFLLFVMICTSSAECVHDVIMQNRTRLCRKYYYYYRDQGSVCFSVGGSSTHNGD